VRVFSIEDGISVFFRVTTERRQAAEEKKKLEAQLQQAKKMRAIGALAGGVANDFNNLLSVIQANASLVLLDIDKEHPCYQSIKSIERQVQRGAKLSAQLLGYAGKGRYKVRTINIEQIVQRTCDAFSAKQKDISIRCDLAGDLFPTDADPVQIEQVLRNLYSNAADAMPHGGELIVKTKNAVELMPKLDCEPTDYVSVMVSDNGVGMDKDVQERVFEPFFTTKESAKRPGLGLTAAYGIIEGHGGFIDFESNKGQGTTFHIYLKASKGTVDSTVVADRHLARGSGTVLLVDDDPMILEVGNRLLKTLGFRILEAKGGREAVDIYKVRKEEIDLVILDMIMPDLDGGETYDKLKALDPDIKVLLTTGYSVDGKATEILERGCDGFLQKPFTLDDLSDQIEAILSKRGKTG
jgi:nitrogen-specific signal transduction histidine kinase/ActR/RegA family two-component response regulator